MNERAKLIKQAMADELAKEGKTIHDLEQEFQKQAAIKGTFFNINPELFVSSAKGLTTLGVSSALAAGMLGGTGLYSAYLANQDSNEQQLKKLKEQQQYEEATQVLKNKMQHPTIM